MFLGYQNNKIVLAAKTRKELENTPFIFFDRVEETSDEYVKFNGEYILKAEADARKHRDDILSQIESLESQITYRNIRSAILGDEWATNKITQIESQIANLRAQLGD